MVCIAGQIVLDAGYPPLSPDASLDKPFSFAFPSYIAYRQRGANQRQGFFHLNANDSVDMNVMIGDYGGVCSFFPLVEKVGNSYGSGSNYVYPFFQIGNKDARLFR